MKQVAIVPAREKLNLVHLSELVLVCSEIIAVRFILSPSQVSQDESAFCSIALKLDHP